MFDRFLDVAIFLSLFGALAVGGCMALLPALEVLSLYY